MTHINLLKIVILTLVVLCFQTYAQVPEPTRFEKSIQRFEQQDAQTMPPKGAIVLTGSSSIAIWNEQAQDALAPLTVIARGFGGSNMNDLLFYIERVAIKYQPRAILIYEGDNDTALSPPIPTTTILSQLQQIISKVHHSLPDTRIYILSVKPSIARKSVWPLAQQVSKEFKAIADAQPLVHYVDIASPFLKPDGSVMDDIFVSDNLHLNAKGNEIWGQTIKAALMPIEAQYE